jgi:1-acyl-sn-glycerol-3-phosphate acyltransferase
MAAKRVLGNDPFKRGAAARVPLATAPTKKQPPAKRPVTPEMQVSTSALKGPSKPVPAPRKGAVATDSGKGRFALGRAPGPREGSLTLSRAPTPHPGATVTLSVSHAGSPEGQSLDQRPVAHPASPRLSVEPTAHDAAPVAQVLGSAPVAHRSSPGLPLEPTAHDAAPVAQVLGAAPVAHRSSPGLPLEPTAHDAAPVAQVLGAAPVAHRSSPGVPLEPTAHDAAPVAQVLGAAPVAHRSSPGVPLEPTAHSAAPEAVPLTSTPIPHGGSPRLDAEPVPHAAAPEGRPLTHGPVSHGATPEAVSVASRTPPPPRSPPLADTSAPLVEVPRASTSPSLLSTEGAVSSAQGLAAVLRTLLGRATAETRVDGFGRDEALVSKLQPLADAVYDGWFRVTVEGVEQVPRGPCLLVANHAGALPIDGPVLHHALKRNRPELAPARWLLEDQVFHAPGLGVLWNRLGAVRASPENAHALLEQGAPVIVFPEGFQGLSKPFAERYRLQRFGRGGYVKIAARARVPVVPVAIVGAEESVPLLAKLPGGVFGLPFLPLTLPPLPARWFIRFGAPVSLEDAGPAAADDLAWVQRTNEAVRDGIEAMLKALLERRGGVF